MSSTDLLPLTDDFWLAAHDTSSGKPHLAAGPLGIGLATGLLAELLGTKNVSIQDGSLYLEYAPAPDDVALAPITDLLADEEQRLRDRAPALHRQAGLDLREWIRFLAIDDRAGELVTNRLSRSGSIVLKPRRRLFGGPATRFMPRDSVVSGTPASRITISLHRGESLDEQSLMLAGLMLATGLHQESLASVTATERAALAPQLRSLHPMLRELLRCAEQLVGEAVMNR